MMTECAATAARLIVVHRPGRHTISEHPGCAQTVHAPEWTEEADERMQRRDGAFGIRHEQQMRA